MYALPCDRARSSVVLALLGGRARVQNLGGIILPLGLVELDHLGLSRFYVVASLISHIHLSLALPHGRARPMHF